MPLNTASLCRKEIDSHNVVAFTPPAADNKIKLCEEITIVIRNGQIVKFEQRYY